MKIFKSPWFYIMLLTVLLALVSYQLYRQTQIASELALIQVQNELAFKDKIKVLKDREDELYHKYIHITSLNDSLNLVLEKRNERILFLTNQIVKLETIISEGSTSDTTIVVDSSCYGKTIPFLVATDTYSYDLKVTLAKKPYHKLEFTLKPFNLKSYITRNKEGIFSTYLEVQPEFRNLVKIQNVETTMDKDEYIELEKNKIEWKVFPSTGALVNPNVTLFFGAGVSINKHQIQVQHGLGNSNWYLNYGYYLFGN